MVAMPPHRPPHLHREKTRHGKLVWYVRVGGSSRGPRLRPHAEYGTAKFWEEYQAALAKLDRAPGHCRKLAQEPIGKASSHRQQ